MADSSTKRPFLTLALASVLTLVAAACSDDDDAAARRTFIPDDGTTAGEGDDTLTVYARDRFIAEPLFERFEQETGIEIRPRWGDPIDLADQIIEAGTSSPADVYYGPLSDALGSLSAAGRLAKLSDEQLERVPAAYRSPDGTWVGTSGRAHVVFYNADRLSAAADLPDSILGFTDPAWRGRMGWDPTSRSLRDVVTELGQIGGEEAAREWLEGIQANAPAAFEGAAPIITAVSAGEIIDVGFGSHSYLNELQDDGDALNVGAKFYLGAEPGGLLNVAGVGIVEGTDNKAAADELVDFMLSQGVQQSFARAEAFEIPLVEGVQPPAGMPTAVELTVPGLDVRKLEELQVADRLLAEAGVIG